MTPLRWLIDLIRGESRPNQIMVALLVGWLLWLWLAEDASASCAIEVPATVIRAAEVRV